MNFAQTLSRFPLLLVALVLVACAANPAIEESRRLFDEGRLEDSVARLEKAMKADANDRELRTLYFRQRDLVVAQMLNAAQTERMARNTAAAQDIYKRVLKLDANNPRVRDGLADITALQRLDTLARDAQGMLAKGDSANAERVLRMVLSENPNHGEARRMLQSLQEQAARMDAPAQTLKTSFSKAITLEFRDAPLKTVFEVIARSSGINFVFDKDVRSDTKITIFMRNTSIDDVVKLILVSNQLERKVLNENSILIYPNTLAKAKDYLELVTRSFYLANADVKQAQALVRTMVKTKDIFVDEKLNLLVIKDTPQAVALAEKLLESLDMAEPEVMLEVEVLEMTRSKLQELGLRFPDQIGYGLLQPSSTSTIVNSGVTQTSTSLGGSLAAGYVDLRNTGGLTTFVSNPALMLNLRSEAGDGNLLANPRIRVKNREKAKIHIGDKLPVFTTTSTANVGVAASVSYLDVGLKLDVEPNVFLDDEVSIKVGLEVSSIVKEIPGPASSLAYQIGTRSAATVLRLKNGETQVLAGLISNEERSSANRLPGLGELPVVGRLFSNQRDNSSKTEIVLLITPRIIRNLARNQATSVMVPAGSESTIGAPALTLRKAEPRTLSLSSSLPGAPGSVPDLPAAPDTPAGGLPSPFSALPVPGDDVPEVTAAPTTTPTPVPTAPTALSRPAVTVRGGLPSTSFPAAVSASPTSLPPGSVSPDTGMVAP